MSRRFYASVLMFLVCMAMVLTGSCAGHKETASADPSKSGDVPPALLQINDGAQAVIDAVPLENWPRIYAYIQSMDNAWTDYKRPSVTAWSRLHQPLGTKLRSDLELALTRLRRAAVAQDPAGTRAAATDVQAAVIGLFQFYRVGDD